MNRVNLSNVFKANMKDINADRVVIIANPYLAH